MIIAFASGGSALAVEVTADVGGDDLVAALGLPVPRATVVVNGTAAELDDGLAARLSSVLGAAGLGGAAARGGLTVVTGGTDAGIFSIVGGGVGGRSAPLVGVAPQRLVTWPGEPEAHRVPLEPHHSHFVLVDGDEWGAETPVLLALARALTAVAPSVAVICGGGPVTRREVLGHVRDGRSLVVLAGSGRVADELAAAHPPDDPETAEIVARGDITVCPVADGGPALVEAVFAALGPI